MDGPITTNGQNREKAQGQQRDRELGDYGVRGGRRAYRFYEGEKSRY